MAVTSPDNIWTPDGGDPYALTVDLAATADSVQDAITSLRNSKQDTLERVSGFARPSGTFASSGTFSITDLTPISLSGGVTLTGGNTFLIPKSGVYLVSFFVRLSDPGNAGSISIGAALGGSTSNYPVLIRQEKFTYSTAGYSASGAIIASGGGSINLRLWQGGGADVTIDSSNSIFSIVHVSP